MQLATRRVPCPGPEFEPRSTTAYRFLRKPATEADFEPNPKNLGPKAPCKAYAISLWETLEKAQKIYSDLASGHDDSGATAIQEYGDHIGEIALQPSDGVMDLPNRRGHISLHVEEGVLFAPRVVVYTLCEYLTYLSTGDGDGGEHARP